MQFQRPSVLQEPVKAPELEEEEPDSEPLPEDEDEGAADVVGFAGTTVAEVGAKTPGAPSDSAGSLLLGSGSAVGVAPTVAPTLTLTPAPVPAGVEEELEGVEGEPEPPLTVHAGVPEHAS
jgi:hypothetical protein